VYQIKATEEFIFSIPYVLFDEIEPLEIYVKISFSLASFAYGFLQLAFPSSGQAKITFILHRSAA
jgi:hypothetical protein